MTKFQLSCSWSWDNHKRFEGETWVRAPFLYCNSRGDLWFVSDLIGFCSCCCCCCNNCEANMIVCGCIWFITGVVAGVGGVDIICMCCAVNSGHALRGHVMLPLNIRLCRGHLVRWLGLVLLQCCGGRVCASGDVLVNDWQRVQSPPHSNGICVRDHMLFRMSKIMGECVGREVYSLGVWDLRASLRWPTTSLNRDRLWWQDVTMTGWWRRDNDDDDYIGMSSL